MRGSPAEGTRFGSEAPSKRSGLGSYVALFDFPGRPRGDLDTHVAVVRRGSCGARPPGSSGVSPSVSCVTSPSEASVF